MNRKLLTTALLALFATSAAAVTANAQTYDYYDDSPVEWQYGVDLDGK